MKILMVPTLNAPVVFYRMEQNVNELRRMGHEVAFSYRGHDHYGGCRWEGQLKEEFGTKEGGTFLTVIDQLMKACDVAVFQVVHSQHSYAVLEMMKDKYKKPMLLDMDDDPYTTTPMNPTALRPGSDMEWWVDSHIKMADGIIASTPHIAQRFRDVGKRVDVVPNAIDFELWDALKKTQRKGPTVGWVGGAGHRLDLRLLEGVAERTPGVKYSIYSGHLPVSTLKHSRVSQVHMTLKIEGMSPPKDTQWWKPIGKYPKWLAARGLWVGLAPLVDSEFNRAKSNLRWLEYSAMGIPTVASRVAPFRDSILNGKTGIFADDTDEWVRAVRLLTADKGLRKEMGGLARDKVREEFNISDTARKYEGILEGYC